MWLGPNPYSLRITAQSPRPTEIILPTAPTTVPACLPDCEPAKPGKRTSTHNSACPHFAAVKAAGDLGLSQPYPIGSTVEIDGGSHVLAFVVAEPTGAVAPSLNPTDVWVWIEDHHGSDGPRAVNVDRVELLPPIPTNRNALYALMSATDRGGRHDILVRLERQIGDRDRAFKLWDDIDTEVQHYEQVTQARSDLTEELAGANSAIADAYAKLRLLTGSLGDEDLEHAPLLEHYLDVATTAIATAVALGPKKA